MWGVDKFVTGGSFGFFWVTFFALTGTLEYFDLPQYDRSLGILLGVWAVVTFVAVADIYDELVPPVAERQPLDLLKLHDNKVAFARYNNYKPKTTPFLKKWPFIKTQLAVGFIAVFMMPFVVVWVGTYHVVRDWYVIRKQRRELEQAQILAQNKLLHDVYERYHGHHRITR